MLYFLRTICFALFISISTFSIAQENSCKNITEASLPKLTQLFEKNDFDNILSLLTTIEATCGTNEVTQRLRVFKDIIEKKDSKASIDNYLKTGMDNKLIQRYDDAASNNFQSLFRKKPEDYFYVPLRSRLDSLTQQKATALLNSDQYSLKTEEENIILLFADDINSYLMNMQKEKPMSRSEKSEAIEYYKDRIAFSILGGIYTPLYGTNTTFRTNPIFGVSVMSPIANQWIFDGFFKVRINSSDRDFDYNLYDEVNRVNSAASYMVGASVGYKFLDLGKFLMLGKAGIAFESLDTGLSEVFDYDYPDEYGNYSSVTVHNVNTFNASAGISAMRHVFGKTFAGLQLQYHYSPYNVDSNLITEVESNYVSVELFLRF